MEGDEDTEMKRERVQTSTHNYAARAVVVASRRRERSVRDPLQIIYELPSYFFPVESESTRQVLLVFVVFSKLRILIFSLNQ